MTKILYLTDTHVFANGRTFHGVDTQRRLLSALLLIARHRSESDIVVHGGDVAGLDADSHDCEWYCSELRRVGFLPRLVPGNHDRAKGGEIPRTLKNLEQNGWPWFIERDGWTIWGLDSSRGRLGAEQISILESASRRAPSDLLVLLHHHVEPVGCSWLDDLILQDREALHEVLRSVATNGFEVWVFSGHVHMQTTRGREGVCYVTTPAVSYQFARDDRSEITAERGAVRVIQLGQKSLMTHILEVKSQ